MSKDVIMPRFDPEMKTGKVVEWLKKEGDQVSKGEPIARIDTEKVTVEIESPDSGILSKILIFAPQEVEIGTPIGVIDLDSEKKPLSELQLKSSSSEVQNHMISERVDQIPETQSGLNLLRASPAARRVARERGIDLSQVSGSGPAGRITTKDVLELAMSRTENSSIVHTNLPPKGELTESFQEKNREEMRMKEVDGEQPLEAKVSSKSEPIATTPPAEPEYKIIQPSSMRRSIAEKMVKSWTQIPQVPLFVDIDLTESDKFRAAMEKLGKSRTSFTAVVTKAVASALRSFNDLNSRFEEDGIHQYEDVDISIAVAIESGLITPVVRRANRKTATDISLEIEDLASRARDRKLTLPEVKGGTVSISNLASFGVDFFIPIINPPQASIVGIGRSRTSPNGTRYCTITLVFDHRITDGARAAQFLQKIKDYIENPYLLQMS